jgi:hypothetical protein
MRKIMRVITPVVASAALVLLTAGPAFAADAGTGTTFTITGGALTISAPGGTVSLGTGAASVAAQTITGSLGPVTVTDSRGNILGWVTSAISTAFTSGGLTVPATAISYGLSAPTVTGTATVVPLAAVDLTAAKTVETATAVIGVNTAVWNPSISVAVPLSAQTGVYTATMTHSVI